MSAPRIPYTSGIIVAAGSGTRMGGVNKPLIKLGKRTVFELVLDAFLSSHVSEIVIVCTDKTPFLPLIPQKSTKKISFALGGKSRTESVYNGVGASSWQTEFVCIHDCARPFCSASMINKVIEAALESGAASASCPCTDTVKYINEDKKTTLTLDRSLVRLVQTPQCFAKKSYLVFYYDALNKGLTERATDETTLAQSAGMRVNFVDTGKENIKLTTPNDIKSAKALMFLIEKGEIIL